MFWWYLQTPVFLFFFWVPYLHFFIFFLYFCLSISFLIFSLVFFDFIKTTKKKSVLERLPQIRNFKWGYLQNSYWRSLNKEINKTEKKMYQSVKVTPPTHPPPIFSRTPSLRKRSKSIGSGVGIRPPPPKWEGLTLIDWYYIKKRIDWFFKFFPKFKSSLSQVFLLLLKMPLVISNVKWW